MKVGRVYQYHSKNPSASNNNIIVKCIKKSNTADYVAHYVKIIMKSNEKSLKEGTTYTIYKRDRKYYKWLR